MRSLRGSLAILIALLSCWNPSFSEAPKEYDTQSCELPLSYNSDLPYIEIDNIGFFIDSGASISIASPNLLPRGANPQEQFLANTFSSPLSLTTYSDTITIDFCGITDFKATTISRQSKATSSLFKEIEKGRSILVGRDILNANKIVIDNVSKTLTITKVEASKVQRDRSVWPFMIQISVAGKNFTCLLDTGFSHRAAVFVPVRSELHQYLNSNEYIRWEGIHAASTTGSVANVYVPSATILGMRGEGLVFSLEEGADDRQNDLKQYCVIGNDFLRSSTVGLSPHRQFAFVQGELPRPEYNNWGIRSLEYDQKNEKVSIGSLDKRFDAYSNGLREGDVILRVDNLDIDLTTINVLRERAYATKGAYTNLAILRGEKVIYLTIVNSDPIRNNF